MTKIAFRPHTVKASRQVPCAGKCQKPIERGAWCIHRGGREYYCESCSREQGYVLNLPCLPKKKAGKTAEREES